MEDKYKFAGIAIIVLCCFPLVCIKFLGMRYVFGVLIPYTALSIFLLGFISKVIGWSMSAVPFRIPTTCGQQESLPWIKANKIDCPFTKKGVVIRMLLEIFAFRSLFRNTKFSMDKNGPKMTFSWELWLWVFALAFHYSFLTVIIRHMRFFTDPIPLCITIVEKLDGILQIGLPGIFISGFVLLGAICFLFLRRIMIPQVRYISLAADYFPLLLIIAIVLSGMYMRYISKVDVVGIKSFTMGLVMFKPVIPDTISVMFYIHLFLVCTLLVYFPFSKLMHMGGIFLSPTRNLTCDTRQKRHINPWNYPVKVHTYEEYEDDFREKMIEAGLPVEKES
ncbi:MAG: sulfate reduction electron transfer complex DsrMKJOP subunit DsrM [Desulfobacterales bacterium]|nr:sulfate reduction electron transfer complex DsrMKJOP subunit DsrM [Desulfobacterales bacterium]